MASYAKRTLSVLGVHEIVDYLLDQYDANEVSRAIANWFVPEESYIQKPKKSKQSVLNFTKHIKTTKKMSEDKQSTPESESESVACQNMDANDANDANDDANDDANVVVVAKKYTKPSKPVSDKKKEKNPIKSVEKPVKNEKKIKVRKIKVDNLVSSQDDDEPQINVNVGRLKKSKQAATDSKFRTKQLKFKADCSTCTGYLASGKPCTKTKIVEYGMCTRCCGELKEKGQVHFDEDLGYYYRDVKFIVDDPNGMFFKGQEVRQYSQYSRAFDFNGAQCHRRYYVFTRKDVLDDFKSCTFITSSCPFFKSATLKPTNIERYRLESEPEPEPEPEETVEETDVGTETDCYETGQDENTEVEEDGEEERNAEVNEDEDEDDDDDDDLFDEDDAEFDFDDDNDDEF